jgi:hypothetical protein
MHKLMIKTHRKTGLKYLCYTQKEDHCSYTGSGIFWKKHLKQHGVDIVTEVIYETDSYDDFVRVAKEKSLQLNVVESTEWANLKLEEGDGGDTVSSKRWITNGSIDMYWDKDSDLLEGWWFGRTNCRFNDSNFQRDMSSRSRLAQTPEIRYQAAAKATETKRQRGSFPNISGDLNPSKREDVKEKLKAAALKRPNVVCPHCGKEGQSSPGMYRFHFNKCKQYVDHTN